MKTQPNEKEQPIPETTECDDCGQPFKTAQGLAGHRRLAHSTRTARELDERKRSTEQKETELRARETVAERKAEEATRSTEAVRRREAEIARRQRELAAAEAIPEAERLRKIVEEHVGALPEVTTETILRCEGRDYRIEDGRLIHLYWPDGEKTECEDGEWFRFEGRAYAIREERLREVPPKEILGAIFEED